MDARDCGPKVAGLAKARGGNEGQPATAQIRLLFNSNKCGEQFTEAHQSCIPTPFREKPDDDDSHAPNQKRICKN